MTTVRPSLAFPALPVFCFGIILQLSAPLAVAQRPGFNIPEFQRPGVRGRIYIRNGPLGQVYREHWGSGVTDNGAMVLNNLITTAGVVAPPLITALTGVGVPGAATGGEAEAAEDELAEVESFDPNAAARRAQITAITARSEKIFERLGMPPFQPSVPTARIDQAAVNSAAPAPSQTAPANPVDPHVDPSLVE